jgi:hypothetical protein
MEGCMNTKKSKMGKYLDKHPGVFAALVAALVALAVGMILLIDPVHGILRH